MALFAFLPNTLAPVDTDLVLWHRTLGVLDNARLLALHYCYGGVGGTKIDTDDLALNLLLCISSPKRRIYGRADGWCACDRCCPREGLGELVSFDIVR